MSNLTQPMSLEMRLTTKLKESLGDIISDDDIKGFVARGIENALFQKRQVPSRQTYGDRYDTVPSLVDELTAKYLGEKMREAVDAWLRENPDRLQAAIDSAIKAGVAKALIDTLDTRFCDIFSNGVQQLKYQGLLPSNT